MPRRRRWIPLNAQALDVVAGVLLATLLLLAVAGAIWLARWLLALRG